MQSAKEHMDLQTAVRMNAVEFTDMHNDLKTWERQIKAEEKRNKSDDNVQPDTDAASPTNRVEIYKTEGNNFYKKGDYDRAIKFYTKAIAADKAQEYCSVLYSNRSQCNLYLENYEECVIDCNESLLLDPNSEKTNYRRMCANEKLNNLALALKDCQAVLKINPQNKGAQDFLARSNANNEKNSKNVRKYKSKLDGLGDDVSFIQKAVHLQSREPMKRITIVDNSLTQDNNVVTNGESIAMASVAKVIKTIEEIPRAPDSSTSEIDEKCMSFIEKTEKKEEFYTGEVKKDTKELENLAIKSEKVPSPPTSSAVFFKTWKNLPDSHARYHYLKGIPSTGFSALVSSQLDSSILSQILAVLSEYFVRDRVPVMGFLRALSVSNELPILSMMMSSADKMAFQTLIDFSNQMHQEEMQAILKAFSI